MKPGPPAADPPAAGDPADGPRAGARPRRRALALALAIILALAPGAAGSQVAPASPTPPTSVSAAAPVALGRAIRDLERELAADVVRDSVGSIAAAVFVGGEVVWRGAFGWRERENGTLAGSETIYRVGSITKIVTALVLLRLVDAGVVSLDDSVARFLPELGRLRSPVGPESGNGSPGAGSITLRELAAHTSGLSREPDRSRFGRGAFAEWKRKTVAAIPHTRLVDEPGSGYRYSNIGYALLGLALERAADRPFEVLADSLVFRPLGMISTSFVVAADRHRVAAGYVNLPGDTADPRVPRSEHRGRGYRVPSGGLYSTVGDLSRLGMAIAGASTLVPDSLRRLMLTGAGSDRGFDYGLGVQLLELGPVALAGHSGTVPGYAAYLLVDPERRAGVVLLRNYNHGATNLGAVAVRLLLRLRDPR